MYSLIVFGGNCFFFFFSFFFFFFYFFFQAEDGIRDDLVTGVQTCALPISTSVDGLGWKNKTTIPKICQIRDNLHANYISALFPNDNWVRWEGDSNDDEEATKKLAIEGYIATKARQSNLRDTESSLLYDYIDTGNAFSTNAYVREVSYDPIDGAEIKGYTGPKVYRIDPMDIVFNPVAPEFYMAPKSVRDRKRVG